MPSKKEIRFNKTYEAYIALMGDGPLDQLEDLVVEDIMGYGTAQDEVIFTRQNFKDLLLTQREQQEDNKITIDRKAIFQKYSDDLDFGCIVEELDVTIYIGEDIHNIPLRFSTVLQYNSGLWKVIHWHASIAQDGTSDDTWHINEWKTKAEQLTLLVDEKTAELKEQNRALEIEAALERLRLATMAMRKSEQLAKVVTVLFRQFEALEINIIMAFMGIYHIEEKYVHQWFSPIDGVKEEAFFIRLPTAPWENTTIKDWKSGKELSFETIRGKEAIIQYSKKIDALANWNLFEGMVKKLDVDTIEQTEANHQYGNLSIVQERKATPAEIAILKRFAKVFEQTYTRFLDLQKAETQTREAQIEVSLERIRAKAMAMHHSDDLSQAVAIVFQELDALNLTAFRCGIGIICGETKNVQLWTSTSTKGEYLAQVTGDEFLKGHPLLEAIFDHWKNQEALNYVLAGKERTDYYKALAKTNFRLPEEIESVDSERIEYYHSTYFPEGGLYAYKHTPFTEEAISVMKRFADVFHLTYTRYSDLQKAEAQTMEAQIEAALERVRSKSLSMRHSNELAEAAELLYDELLKFKIQSFSCGYVINNDKNGEWMVWMTDPKDNSFEDSWTLPYDADPILQSRYESWKRKEDFHYSLLEGKDNLTHHTEISKYAPWKAEMLDQLPDRLVLNSAHFSLGHLLVVSPDILTPEIKAILIRFAKVFEQTYIRFLDLKKAELQTREAQIETALEKVRSRTVAMHESTELAATAQVMFNQLELLGLKTWAAGFNICGVEDNVSEAWICLQGHVQMPFTMQHDEDPSFIRIYNHWKNKSNYYEEELGGADLVKHYEYMFHNSGAAKLDIQAIEAKVDIHSPPTYQVFNCAYFKHGYLIFITFEKQPEYRSLFMRFAQVFEQSYIRFLDLKTKEEQAEKIKEEKTRLEKTLENLKATQAQLIQAEKMASLGELTAGIAHEIQNPLNFVNNFSEVSGELLQEAKEELEKGDIEEAKEIMSDLIENLEKISHHGKRASSIVKGMLDHSRASTDEKVLTDINKLADEYMRLSYHGLRAKDRSFNADFQIILDESLPHINVIPQELGRVFLNILNNAFFAVDKKNKASTDHQYKPLVRIKTKSEKSSIVITIDDNGEGMSQNTIDKVFQPFFTTKPTGQGTGLGMSISYDIVKAHGGQINVESKAMDGTKFIINLPIV